MFEPSFSRAGRRRSRLRSLYAFGLGVVSLTTIVMAACSSETSTEPGGARIVYGPAQNLGQGTARVYVALDDRSKPTALGVALSENAMTGLPMTPLPGGGVSAATLILALPQEARITGFDHAMLDWNPMGHEPEMVYTLPHFDFHFYTMTEAAQMAIMPTDAEYEAKLEKMPEEKYRPAGNVKLPGGVPMMGAHWADMTSPELQPPPNNKTFTQTFLYGSYDGHFIFYEPMITKAYIESIKTASGSAVSTPIKVATAFETPGYYPTKYSIRWDAASKEYRIALDSLVPRNQ